MFNPGAAEDGKYGILIINGSNVKLYHKQI